MVTPDSLFQMTSAVSLNSSEIPSDDIGNGEKELSFFKLHIEEHLEPLTFAFWFFITILAKIAFQQFECVKRILPDSALLLVLGVVFGAILHAMFPELKQIVLEPNWFFFYLLPPIALDAGYFMPNKEFFNNFGTITTYAVIGTLWNTAATGLALFAFKGFYADTPSTIHIFLFATLISAVDPVAVICVFEEIHVNEVLNICMFGESLLNDAVTIVLYRTMEAIAHVGLENVHWYHYPLGVLSFFWVSLGGILLGILFTLATGLITKWAAELTVIQPLVCLLLPYLGYLIADSAGVSGILAIFVCGMFMKQYIEKNITPQSQVTVDYFMKTLSSNCEAVIFVFLGLSAVTMKHDLDYIFMAISCAACFIFRFVGVFMLTSLVNKVRIERISLVDQFIMGYGGLRGAVCFGLVMSLDKGIEQRNMFASTTIIIIFLTVFIQGGTIERLVTLLHVRLQKTHKQTLFDKMNSSLCSHLIGGIEAIIGQRGYYWYQAKFERINSKYIAPVTMQTKDDMGMSIFYLNQDIQREEVEEHLKKHGTLAGMSGLSSTETDSYYEHTEPTANLIEAAFPLPPNRQSVQRIRPESVQRMSQGPRRDGVTENSPTKESMELFLANKLAEAPTKTVRYSRHLSAKDVLRNTKR